MAGPEQLRRVGAFEAMSNRLGARYLPGLAGVMAQGYARQLDIFGYPGQIIADIEDEESRRRWEGVAAAGMHGSAAMLAHTGSALLENVGAVTQAQGFAEPLEGLAAPMREFYLKHAQAREEASKEFGLQQQVAAGAIEALGAIPEFAGVAAALSAGGIPMALALPLLMANRASRDPVSGEATGFYETGKGAATGAAMHGVFRGAGYLEGGLARFGATGGGMAALTAIEDGSNQDIAASFFLGGGMSALSGRRNDPRDPAREAQKYERQNINMIDREYARQDASHALLDGLKAAERRMKAPQEAPENGVPRPYFDFEPNAVRPEPYRVTGPVIPDEGFPATAIPGQPTTKWQARLVQDAIARGENPVVWAGRLKIHNILKPEQELAAAKEILEQHGGAEAFYGAHRGTVKWDETIMNANLRIGARLGETPEETMKRVQSGRGVDPEEAAATDMIDMIRSVQLDTASKRVSDRIPGAERELADAITNKVASLYANTAARATAGRTLNIYAQKAAKLKRLRAAGALRSLGGESNVRNLNDVIRGLEDPNAMFSVLRSEVESASRGKVHTAFDAWKAGLLSAFSTQMANIKSTALFVGLNYGYEQPVAAAIGVAKIPVQRGIARVAGERDYRQTPTTLGKEDFLGQHRTRLLAERPGLDPANRLQAQEAVGQLWSIVTGHKYAFDAMQKSWRSGDEFSPTPGLKVDTPYGIAGSRLKSWLPFRALTAFDAYFGGATYAAEMLGKGVREASDKRIPLIDTPEYARQFVREVDSPIEGTPHARLNVLAKHQREALVKANELKFTNPLGRIGAGLVSFKNTSPWMEPILTFLKTPINVTKQGFYRIPLLGLASPKMLADLQAGGKRQNEALARISTGAIIGIAIYDQVLEGKLKGATPTDPGERELQRSMGISPLSYETTGGGGERLFESYARLEPLATPIAMIATVIDAHEKGRLSIDDLQGAVELISGTLAEIVVNRSTMQGPRKFMEAVTDPERRMGSYIDSLVSSVVPAFLNSVARGEDPFRRDQTGLPEAIWARLPWEARTPELARKLGFGESVFRESLPVLHDLVGRPMTTGDPSHQSVARMFDEFSSPVTPDPLLDAMALSGAGIQRTSKMVSIRPKDMWAPGDRDLPLLGHSLQKELHIEMTQTQREWVNSKANKAAADELRPIVPKLMKVPSLTQEISLEALLGKGVPRDVVDQMRAAGISRAAMIDAVRDLFRSTYSRHRNQHTNAIIDHWRRDGTLRAEVEKQLRLENRLQGYRLQHSGGPQ